MIANRDTRAEGNNPDAKDVTYGRTDARTYDHTSSCAGVEVSPFDSSTVRQSVSTPVRHNLGDHELMRLAWRLAKNLLEEGQTNNPNTVITACQRLLPNDAERCGDLEGAVWEAIERIETNRVNFDFDEIVSIARHDVRNTELHTDLPDPIRLLALVCRQLALRQDGTLYMATRKAAEVMGRKHPQDGVRAMKLLVGRGILEVVSRGRPRGIDGRDGETATYRYLHDDAGDDECF